MMKIKTALDNVYIHSVVFRALTLIISMLQSAILARYLGAELKGETSYISSIVAILAIVMSFGTHQAYPYYKKNRLDEDFLNKFISLVLIYHVLALTLLSLACNMLTTSTILFSILIVTPFYSYSKVTGYICLIENPVKCNNINFLSLIIKLIATVIAWFAIKKSFVIAIILISFDQIIRCFLFTIMLFRSLHVKVSFSRKSIHMAKSLLSFGLFPMLALLMSTLNYKIDTIIMGNMLQYVGMSGIGIYSIGQNLAEKVEIIPDTLQGVLASKLAKGSNDNEVAKVCRICFAVCFIIFALILIFGKYIIYFLYGDEYEGAFWVTVITACGLLPLGFFRLIGQYNIVNKKQNLNVIILLISIIINIILDIILIPFLGIIGAALATTAGNAICGIAFLAYFSYATKIKLSKLLIINKNDLISFRQIIGF